MARKGDINSVSPATITIFSGANSGRVASEFE